MYNLGNNSLVNPFINSYVKINNDEKYMEMYRERERDIRMIF
jgi:hypothetical protein